MGRTTESAPIPIEETYRELLRVAIEAAGTQAKVAKLAGVTQGTISRLLKPLSRATYTTLHKLATLLGLPPPVIAVRDAAHARWCAFGSQLAAHRPDEFRSLLQLVELVASGAQMSNHK